MQDSISVQARTQLIRINLNRKWNVFVRTASGSVAPTSVLGDHDSELVPVLVGLDEHVVRVKLWAELNGDDQLPPKGYLVLNERQLRTVTGSDVARSGRERRTSVGYQLNYRGY